MNATIAGDVHNKRDSFMSTETLGFLALLPVVQARYGVSAPVNWHDAEALKKHGGTTVAAKKTRTGPDRSSGE
jgi:hypothetical protein